MSDDFGFSAVSEEELKQSITPTDSRAQEMYDSILPLLNNLRKDSDKPYINWANRKQQIDDFEKKLKNILERKG